MIDMAVAIPPPRQEQEDSQETVDAPASIEPERETATEIPAADNVTDDCKDGTREALVSSELMDDSATGKIDDDMKESASEEVIKTAKNSEMNTFLEADKHKDPTSTVPCSSNLSTSEESSMEDILEGEAKEVIMEILENVESPGSFAVG